MVSKVRRVTNKSSASVSTAPGATRSIVEVNETTRQSDEQFHPRNSNLSETRVIGNRNESGEFLRAQRYFSLTNFVFILCFAVVSLQYIRDPMAFVYDSYVLRMCLPNFEHDPSSPPLKIRCERSTNAWTGIPICQSLYTVPPTTPSAIACHSEDLPSIPNATIVMEETNETFPVGTRLNFTCLSGIEGTPSFTTCLSDATWSIEDSDVTLCQLNETTGVDVSGDPPTSTTTSATSEMDNATLDFSSESTEPPIAAVHRHVRHVDLACDRFPAIEHAQLIQDETIKTRSANTTLYQGSVTVQCQYGFFSEIYRDRPVRITCQQGEFYPTLQCLGTSRISLDRSRDRNLHFRKTALSTSTADRSGSK